MKKLLSLVLSLALAFSLCVPAMAASESMANFQKMATYNNQFSDVYASYWATPSIKLCYEYGFMKGTTPKQFSPTGALTVAEAIVMADRLHEIYTTGQSTLTNGEPWYQTYVDYAIENGIVQSGDFTSYTAKATRGQMAYLFSRALPASVLPSINNVQTLPDVTSSTKYSQEIFSLYNAGVLTGSDVFGHLQAQRQHHPRRSRRHPHPRGPARTAQDRGAHEAGAVGRCQAGHSAERRGRRHGERRVQRHLRAGRLRRHRHQRDRLCLQGPERDGADRSTDEQHPDPSL